MKYVLTLINLWNSTYFNFFSTTKIWKSCWMKGHWVTISSLDHECKKKNSPQSRLLLVTFLFLARHVHNTKIHYLSFSLYFNQYDFVGLILSLLCNVKLFSVLLLVLLNARIHRTPHHTSLSFLCVTIIRLCLSTFWYLYIVSISFFM